MWLWPMVLSLYLVILYINKSLISCYLFILLSSTSDPTLHSQNGWNISLLWIIPVSFLQLWYLNFSDLKAWNEEFIETFVWPESSAWWTCIGWHMQCKMCIAVLLGFLEQHQVSFKMEHLFFKTQAYGLKLVIFFNVRDTNILQQLCGDFCPHKRGVRRDFWEMV